MKRDIVDGRGIGFLAVADDAGHTFFPYDMIPSQRPLWAIVQAIADHGTDNPSHGYNCVCMDGFSLEIRQHVGRGLPEHPPLGDRKAMAHYWISRERLVHVLRMVTDHL